MTLRYSFLGLALLLGSIAGCGQPPQLGDEDEAFKSVDALYTAITSKRMQLVEHCATDLKKLKEAGKLTEAAFNSLDEIIGKARKDQWQPAAKDLIWFMKGQKRVRR